ncbi:unnamed protein product [Phaedon cochleariae]|uniref:Uncharacterized protein n=1 Tax=Phaedon cochleariae TaxID=80249 RepID=A0A9P0DSR6_PHACE|nr:unnamed protein product [Phaedon cochleariae]
MEKTLPKSRTSYKNRTKMQLQCRVCFTQSNNVMFDLNDELQLEAKVKISYLQALRQVTSSKVSQYEPYPTSICPVCASLLKMALQLIIQYKTTQLKLNEMFNFSSDETDEGDTKEEDYFQENKPSVELIYKDKKFNVQELVVVEDVNQKTCDYQGFLNNLGREVTATFADYQNLRKKCKEEIEINEVSVAVKEKDRYVPVKEIQIDQSSNQIEYIVEDVIDAGDVKIEDIDIKNENHYRVITSKPEKEAENENNEYTRTESADVIDDFIIKKSKMAMSNNSEIQRIKDEGLKSGFFQCEICAKIYSSWRKLRLHRSRIHLTKDKTYTYTCEICGVQCKSKSTFIHHKLKHTGKRFKCEVCNKSYFTKALLKVHKLGHANERQHLCQVCGATFNYPNALIYHMRLHTGEKSYKCEFCQKMFRMPGALNRHRRTHTNDRPYKCQFCDKRFRSLGEVKSHECIHTGHRPYSCPLCPKGFYKTHNMRVHMLSHPGPYRCPFCPRGLAAPHLLPLHVKTSHKGRTVGPEGVELVEEEDSQGSEEVVYYVEEGGLEGDFEGGLEENLEGEMAVNLEEELEGEQVIC